MHVQQFEEMWSAVFFFTNLRETTWKSFLMGENWTWLKLGGEIVEKILLKKKNSVLSVFHADIFKIKNCYALWYLVWEYSYVYIYIYGIWLMPLSRAANSVNTASSWFTRPGSKQIIKFKILLKMFV